MGRTVMVIRWTDIPLREPRILQEPWCPAFPAEAQACFQNIDAFRRRRSPGKIRDPAAWRRGEHELHAVQGADRPHILEDIAGQPDVEPDPFFRTGHTRLVATAQIDLHRFTRPRAWRAVPRARGKKRAATCHSLRAGELRDSRVWRISPRVVNLPLTMVSSSFTRAFCSSLWSRINRICIEASRRRASAFSARPH